MLKKQFPAFVGEFWNMSQHLPESIDGFTKTWSMKITAVLLKQAQTRVFVSPMSQKITEKERKEGKGARAREKKTSNSL